MTLAAQTQSVASVTNETPVRLGAFEFTSRGLTVTGSPTFEEWAGVGEFLRRAEQSVHWWLGDWIRYGESRWGEMYAQALDGTHFTYDTLRHDVWVAGQIDATRRHPELSWSHHQEVAALPPSEQDYWLERAAEGDGEETPEGSPVPWSKTKLRAAIKAQKAGTPARDVLDELGRLFYEYGQVLAGCTSNVRLWPYMEDRDKARYRQWAQRALDVVRGK